MKIYKNGSKKLIPIKMGDGFLFICEKYKDATMHRMYVICKRYKVFYFL